MLQNIYLIDKMFVSTKSFSSHYQLKTMIHDFCKKKKN